MVLPLRGTFLGCVLTSVFVTGTLAQATLKGVVWDAPFPPLARDLAEMRNAGVEAVRLPLLLDAGLLPVADSLGLQLFQDLPFRYLPAALLVDTLRAAEGLLAQALQRAALHPSARHYGLAYLSETSDLQACGYIEALARKVHSLPGAKAYYLSAFGEHDRCAARVDMVLLDLRHIHDPVAEVAAWPYATSAGVGALGIEARAIAEGLRHPNSPQSQARYLETNLKALLQAGVPAVFVHRWKDASAQEQLWGLVSADGTLHPSYEVVRGLFTGTQSVFAFAAGSQSSRGVPWVILFGWIVILCIGLLVATARRWQNLLLRYFRRHGFYVDAIRSEPQALGFSPALFLAIQSLAVGIAACLLIRLVSQANAADPVLAILGPEWQSRTRVVLSRPWIQMFLFASLYGVVQVAITALSALVAGGRRRFPFKRVLIVQICAKWMYLLLVPLGMVTASLPVSSSVPMTGVITIVWGLILVHSMCRGAVDCAAVFSRRPLAAALGMVSLPLLVMLFGTGLFLLTNAGHYATFWWHLLMHS